MASKFKIAAGILLGVASVAGADDQAPRVLYLCSNCDQYQMGYTEDLLTRTARARGVGVIKLGNSNEYSAYGKYVEHHPKSGAGGLTPLRPISLPYDVNSYPKNDAEAKRRREQSAAAKKVWMGQVLDQLKRLDKAKPVVIHVGNHGMNDEGQDPEKSVFMCYGSSGAHQCLSYGEFAGLLEEAGLTGEGAPPVRLVGDHCYGGGAHSVAMKFPNVCTASVVGYRTGQWSADHASRGAEDSLLLFGATFWRTALQEGARNVSLAEAFNSAWSTVPVDTLGGNPGGTLSSNFYVQKVLGLPDDRLPDHRRPPAFASLERMLASLDGLQAKAEEASGTGDYRNWDAPERSCPGAPAPAIAKIPAGESVLKALRLDQSTNVYATAVARAKAPDFAKKGAAALAAIQKCWDDGKASHARRSAEIQAYQNKSRWSEEFFWTFGAAIDGKKSKFAREQRRSMVTTDLDRLRECVGAQAPTAREYLHALFTLDKLEQLQAFASKATPEQRKFFGRKVACETAPLL